jgi:hypothetical protein
MGKFSVVWKNICPTCIIVGLSSNRKKPMNYIIAICCMAVGFMLALKPDWPMVITGRIEWLERHMGGTKMAYQLLGGILILLSVVIAFGRFRLGFLAQYFKG